MIDVESDSKNALAFVAVIDYLIPLLYAKLASFLKKL
jgi:hypothetical protein